MHSTWYGGRHHRIRAPPTPTQQSEEHSFEVKLLVGRQPRRQAGAAAGGKCAKWRIDVQSKVVTTDEARLVVKGQRCGESGRGDFFYLVINVSKFTLANVKKKPKMLCMCDRWGNMLQSNVSQMKVE